MPSVAAAEEFVQAVVQQLDVFRVLAVKDIPDIIEAFAQMMCSFFDIHAVSSNPLEAENAARIGPEEVDVGLQFAGLVLTLQGQLVEELHTTFLGLFDVFSPSEWQARGSGRIPWGFRTTRPWARACAS